MIKWPYEVRKRLFSHTSRHHINYRCRRCGHDQTVHILDAEKGKFKCGASWCGTEWSAPRYNIIYRLLKCVGIRHPAAYPPNKREEQWAQYKLSIGIREDV